MKRLYIDGPAGLSMFKALSSLLAFSSCTIFAEFLCSGIAYAGELRLFGPQLTSKYESKSLIAEQSASYRSNGSDDDNEGQDRAKN